jgi:amino acid transporter
VTAIVPYSAAALSVPILRKTRGDVKRPFRLPLHIPITLLSFIFATIVIYWGSWPWTLVGSILLLLGYPVFFIAKGKGFSATRSLWVVVYLAGIVVMSIIGDTHFEFNNFTPWKPLGILKMPYDMIVLAIFAILIYWWAYFTNVKKVNSERQGLVFERTK